MREQRRAFWTSFTLILVGLLTVAAVQATVGLPTVVMTALMVVVILGSMAAGRSKLRR